jgi:hypothetical protein
MAYAEKQQFTVKVSKLGFLEKPRVEPRRELLQVCHARAAELLHAWHTKQHKHMHKQAQTPQIASILFLFTIKINERTVNNQVRSANVLGTEEQASTLSTNGS